MRPMTNQEILEYHARKVINDILLTDKYAMRHDMPTVVQNLINDWRQHRHHLKIIKEHRRKYQSLYDTK